MSALTEALDTAAVEFAQQSPGSFADAAFRAGGQWALTHIDWRVLGGLVPGMVEARHVRLGDVVRLSGGVSTVVAVRHHGTPGCVYVTARTTGGADVIYELRTSERVRVDKAATA